MDVILRASGAAVLAAVLVLLLRKTSPETALLLSAAAAAAVLVLAAGILGEAVEFLRDLADGAGMEPAVAGTVLKTVGIAVVTRLAADTCRDAGQSASASAVELCGAAGALYAAIPLMKAVMKTVEDLL